MRPSIINLKRNPSVKHVDDERGIGNGIIITLKPGIFFYDDCGVMGFDTAKEASNAVEKAQGKSVTQPIRVGDKFKWGESIVEVIGTKPGGKVELFDRERSLFTDKWHKDVIKMERVA